MVSAAMKHAISLVFHDDQWADSAILALPVAFSGRRLFRTMYGPKPLLFTYYENHSLEKINKDIAILTSLNEYGVAPYLLHAQHLSSTEALLLTDFKVGQNISFVEGAKHAQSMVEQIKHIHGLPINSSLTAYSIFAQIADFIKPVATMLADVSALLVLIHRIERFVEAHKLPKTLVHNDLHIGNIIIDDNEATHFIDWEYAGLGDPLGDLAIFTINLAFPQDKALRLLYYYYPPQMPSQKSIAHFLLLRRCALFRVGLYYLSTKSKDAALALLARRDIPSFDSLAAAIGNESIALSAPNAIDDLICAAIGVFSHEHDEVEHLLRANDLN